MQKYERSYKMFAAWRLASEWVWASVSIRDSRCLERHVRRGGGSVGEAYYTYIIYNVYNKMYVCTHTYFDTVIY